MFSFGVIVGLAIGLKIGWETAKPEWLTKVEKLIKERFERMVEKK